MFFKLIVLFNFIFLLSCTNDHNFKKNKPVISLSYDSNCLNSLGEAMESYSNEFLSDKEIKRSFKCVIDAVDYIQLKVKGKNKGVYSALEIQNFLNKFLFKNNKKAIDFYERLLAFKNQIFGGNIKNLTFTDLKVLKIFLQEAKELALIMKPHVLELFFKKPFDESVDIRALLRLNSKFLRKWVLFQNNNLNIQEILGFLKGLDVKIKAQESWISIFNLLRSVDSKSIQVKNSDKLDLIKAFENYHVKTLDLYKSLDGNWEFERKSFFEFSFKVENLFLTIGETIKHHPNKKWSLKDLTHVTHLMSEYKFLGKSLSLETQEHILKVIFEKYFSNGNKEVVLDSKNFQEIVSAWSDIKKFLIKAKNIEGHIGEDFPFVQEGEDIFSQFTQSRWPSLVRSNRTIFIPNYSLAVEFSFQSLFHASWQFLFAKLLIKAYSKDLQNGVSQGLGLEQVKEAYLDIFLFLKDLGLLNESSRGSWFRIYNEGNIFVPSAIPDNVVSLSEIADYAAYMFSAYYVGGYIKEYMEQRCPTFDEICSFNYVFNNANEVFESLPGLSQYLMPENFINLTDFKKSHNAWQKNLEYIAKLTNDESPYKKLEWFRASIANQYIEVIFRKYDLDRSNTLSFEEVSLAYKDFKEALKLLPMIRNSKLDDAQLKGVFTFFIKKGKAPKFRKGRPTGPLIKHIILCGGVDTSKKKECMFEADRAQIISILAYMTKTNYENSK